MKPRKLFSSVFTLFLITQFSFALAGEEIPPPKVCPVSLAEAVELALLNSFDIQLLTYDVWIVRTGRGTAESIYDALLTAELEHRDNRQRQTTSIIGTKTTDRDYNAGISRKFPTGTTVGIDMLNNRHSTNSAVATSPLTHESSLGVSVTQELGKNFFGLRDRTNIKLTAVEIEQSEYTSLRRIEQHVAAVQKAYWETVLWVERVKIEGEMLAQAKRLFDLHQEKLQDGLVELPEVIDAEVNYLTRLSEFQFAQSQLKNRSDVLKFLLNIPEENVQIEPTDSLKILEESMDFRSALAAALTSRRDYQSALKDVEAKNLQLTMDENGLWPQVNLTASLTRNGLGDHFKQAVENISREDNPEFFAGVDITIPLENRAARAQHAASELEKASALVRLKQMERKIAVDILNQTRDCSTLSQLAAGRAQIAALQRQKLSEEERRFLGGRSDTNTVIRFQQELTQAQWAAAEAEFEYHSAIVDLKQKEGALLDQYWDGKL